MPSPPVPSRVLAAAMVCLLASATAFGQERVFWVSPTGNDAQAGTRAAPFASLVRARDAIRAERQAGALHNTAVVVNLQAGVYRLTDTFALTAADSGTAQQPTVWQAAAGDTVWLSGGVHLRDWTAVADPAVLARLDPAARTQVRQVNLKALGIEDFGAVQPGAKGAQLFCGGRYMRLARYPNEGWLRVAAVPQEGELKFPGDFRNSAPTRIGADIAGKHYGRFTYAEDRPARWQDTTDLWVHGYWVWDYQDQYHHVQTLDVAKREVWPEPPYHFYGYHRGARYYFLNVLEELDQPGEWHLDRQSGQLCFWPPAGQENAAVVFPLLAKPLLALDGVQHLDLRGLSFEAGRAGAVRLQGGDHVRIAGCRFRNFGDTVIDVRGGTEHTIRSCDLAELGADGIAIAGGERRTLTPGRHVVENCEIHHIGRVQAPYRPAIKLDGVGHRVAHCYIHDCPHGGIGYAGNDHIIEYSEFTRIGYDAGDTGTIYTAMDWTYRGHTIRHNYFHGIHSPPQVHVGSMTVYLDLPTGGLHLYGNVFYDNQRAFFTNSGRDCLIENNIFVQCDPAVQFSSWRDMKLFQEGGAWRMVERLTDGIAYDQPPYSTRYPELLRLFKDGDPRLPTGNVVRCNISTGGQFLALHPLVDFNAVRVEKNLIGDRLCFVGSLTGDGTTGRFAQGDPLLTPLWETAGNVMLPGDPGFVDASREDFRLKADSPAWALGFKAIPFDQIGVQVDEYRQALPLPSPIIVPATQHFLGELVVSAVLPARSPSAVIRYTLDGTEPSAASPVYSQPLTLRVTTTLMAAAFPPPETPGSGSATAAATFTGARLGEGLYLSDLPAVDTVAHTGMKRDVDYHSGPLELAGKTYAKGLLMCPAEVSGGGRGHATWILHGGLRQARRFLATIGIEDMMKQHNIGSAVFIVEVFRQGRWERLFESPVLKLGQVQSVDLDIVGAEQLRLLTTDAGDNIYGDHATWAEARLR